MIINFEFFDEEPIENVITCLHYKFDKVIFFGEKSVLEGRTNYTESFLKKHCNVEEVEFIEISASKPAKVVRTMKNAIERERKTPNNCYFDITGGEGLSLFAFGAVASELNIPVHMYDIVKDELLEFGKDETSYISKNVPSQNIQLNLDTYIEMHGGKINAALNKSIKQRHSDEDVQHLNNLWPITRRFSSYWNRLTNFLAKTAQTMSVNLREDEIPSTIKNLEIKNLDVTKIKKALHACATAGLITNYSTNNSHIRFTYASDFVKQCMCDAGSTLEQYTFLLERNNPSNSDYRVGEHIDWDGIFHPGTYEDVDNEIDVLSLSGKIPSFISCKNGTPNQFAMYELKTVADRFGGKYARKILVTTHRPSRAHMLRAKEMGIEVRLL